MGYLFDMIFYFLSERDPRKLIQLFGHIDRICGHIFIADKAISRKVKNVDILKFICKIFYL